MIDKNGERGHQVQSHDNVSTIDMNAASPTRDELSSPTRMCNSEITRDNVRSKPMNASSVEASCASDVTTVLSQEKVRFVSDDVPLETFVSD